MAYLPAQTYRVTDPIENLQLCVTLRRRATEGERKLNAEVAAGGAKRPARRFKRPTLTKRASAADGGELGSDDEDADAEAAEDAEDADGEARPLRVEREEEETLLCPPRTFRWQEKAFSRGEVRQIRESDEALERPRRASITGMAAELSRSMTGQGAVAALSSHFRAELERLDETARAGGQGSYEGETIYTRVHSERFQTEWTSKFTDSQAEAVTPLARAVMEGLYVREHRDMLGEATCVSMHVLATLPLEADREPTDSAPKLSLGRKLSSALSTTSLLGGESSERKEEEVVLCELRLYPQGRLDIRPPLSYDDDPAAATAVVAAADDESNSKLARWYAVPGTRFEYKIENLTEGVGAAASEQEALAERLAKISTAASVPTSRPLAELDFDVPPRKAARCHYLVTLESVSGFDANAVYVAYYALAAPGWRLLPHCVASAVTQTSYVRGDAARAVLSFPMELTVESDGPPTAARPPLSLFFSVISRDVHERMSQLGYAHLAPPAEAGMSTLRLQAWRLAESRTDALRRFFIGGTEELSDLRAIALPEGFDVANKAQCLNKHGLQTVTTGTLHLKVQTVVQQQKPPAVVPKLGAGRVSAAPAKPSFQRAGPDFGPVRGAAVVSTLARTPTAVDRVFKRLEERRRAEGSAQ